MLFNKLRDSFDNEILISVYTNPDEINRFEVGLLIGVTDEYYALQTYNKLGKSDCLQIGITSDVIRLTDRSPYLDFIRTLVEENFSGLAMLSIGSLEISFDGASRFAIEKDEFVTIVDNYGAPTTGRVITYSEEYIEIDEYDEQGKYEGNLFILLTSIKKMELFGPVEKAIKALAGDKYRTE